MATALDDLEHADLATLRAAQLDRMRWSFGHAYANSPHYREAFDAAGVKPDDLTSLDDLRRFPFTTKADLRARYPFGFFATPMDQIARIHASSGTTGQATVVGYTRRDLDVWTGLVARSIRAAGGQPGMKVHVAYGYGLFTGGLGAHYGAEALGCAVIPMSGGQTEKQVQLICDFAPEIIMVTPSYMLAILDEFRRQGRDPAASSLRIGIFGAEPWGEGMRAEIEATFGIDALDIYGLSEVMGPGVASEYAASKGGPTVWEDHFYPEVVDPETGEPLPDGEEGELVFTSLSKQAFPIVRYRTRDLTRLTPGVVNAMRRMGRITGRSDDMMIIRGVNVFPSQIEAQILALEALAPHYLLEITRPDRLDELKVVVECREGVGEAARAAVAAALRVRVKEVVGVSIAAEVVGPRGVPRSAGKAQRVRDLR